jgi:hypothetical protein
LGAEESTKVAEGALPTVLCTFKNRGFMPGKRHHGSVVGLAAAAVSAAALIGAGSATAAPTVAVLAKGLNTPKYMAFGPGGGLYVAESGTGGGACVGGLGIAGSPTSFCAGTTGSVIDITTTGVRTILKNLPSVIEKDNGEVTGAMALTFTPQKKLVVLMRNTQSDAVGQTSVPGLPQLTFGQLLTPATVRIKTVTTVRENGKTVRKITYVSKSILKSLAKVSAFAAVNPQAGATLGGLPGETLYDSDPHDVTSYRGGYAVADAGANDVVLVSATGKVSLAARLPALNETVPAGSFGPGSPAETIAAQAVPSSVTVGPDGALYVGILRGIPGLPGTAEVDRIVPGQAPVAVVTGLTRVSDLAFTPAGNLLILESNTGGALAPPSAGGALMSATLNPSAAVTATDLGVPGLIDPTGLAVDSSGNAYISNDTAGAGAGEILKVSTIG